MLPQIRSFQAGSQTGSIRGGPVRIELPADYQLFEQRRQDATPVIPQQRTTDQTAIRPALRCISCHAVITTPQDAIEIAGQHRHTCTNPHGFTFTIGCFAQASGILADPTSSTEHSWFPGYAWQIALCSNCTLHLGWRFSGESSFYGLVLNRLLTVPSSGIQQQ